MGLHGGARPGAGRKPSITKALAETITEAVFQVFGSESKAWEALLSDARASRDRRLIFEVLRYWTDRKYGKPVQAVVSEGDAVAGYEFNIPSPERETSEQVQ